MFVAFSYMENRPYISRSGVGARNMIHGVCNIPWTTGIAVRAGDFHDTRNVVQRTIGPWIGQARVSQLSCSTNVCSELELTPQRVFYPHTNRARLEEGGRLGHGILGGRCNAEPAKIRQQGAQLFHAFDDATLKIAALLSNALNSAGGSSSAYCARLKMHDPQMRTLVSNKLSTQQRTLISSRLIVGMQNACLVGIPNNKGCSPHLSYTLENE